MVQINNNRTRAEQLLENNQTILSRSEKLMHQKQLAGSNIPVISNNMVRGVSAERRELMELQLEAGELREQGSGFSVRGSEEKSLRNIPTQAGVVSHNGKNLFKIANSSPLTSGSGGWRGSNDSVQQMPEIYSPLWLNSNLSLPRDRTTINAWCRSFFALNPIVHNAITLHSTYPIAKLNIKSKSKKVEKRCREMMEEIDLMNVCVQLAQEYWTVGEAFAYAELDENKGTWSRLMILNPDYVNIQRSVIATEPIISLRPDENLRRVVSGNLPSDIQQRKQLDPSIIEHVRRNENIPLNNFYVSHIARRIAPFETRGTGLPVSCFRALMLWDRLRESKYYQAESLINPLTLVKIGNQDFRPTPVDLESWRNVFESAASNKDFRIFTHDAVNIERIGAGQGIYDTSADITQLIKEIYIGLMVPSVIMDGSDTTYATGSVALDVLRQRYLQFREYISSWLRKRIFAPISQLNDDYEYIEGEKTLIVPEIDWNHMSLFDMDSYINNMVNLSQGEGAQKRVSLQTLYRSLGLEYEEEQRKIKYEDIQDAIRVKELEALQQHALHELRSMSPGDEIEQIADAPVPGESPNETPPAGGGETSGGPSLPSAMPGSPPPAPIGSGGKPSGSSLF
jgi:hypothetical protein